MEFKDKLTTFSLGLTLLAVITKMKVFETWLDELMKRWVASRPKRRLARRLSDAQLDVVLSSGRESLETLCLMILHDYHADRVTIVEYEHRDGQTLATATVESRQPHMPSVRLGLQQAVILPEIWEEILRIHALPCRCLPVPVARLVELAAMRAALVKTGVASAYYQTLSAAPGHCGALLSVSWKDEHLLDQRELDALHFSARLLAELLRTIWALQPIDKP